FGSPAIGEGFFTVAAFADRLSALAKSGFSRLALGFRKSSVAREKIDRREPNRESRKPVVGRGSQVWPFCGRERSRAPQTARCSRAGVEEREPAGEIPSPGEGSSKFRKGAVAKW